MRTSVESKTSRRVEVLEAQVIKPPKHGKCQWDEKENQVEFA